jgi:guanylate kinase
MKMFSKRKGLLFVISGPSGCGKTTLGQALIKDSSGPVRSISVTTRPRRKGERNGREYFFVSKAEFARLRRKHRFLEWAKIFDHFYGTLRDFVGQKRRQGKDVLLLIDVQGAIQIRKNIPDAVFIFIAPPSYAVLKKRLERRGLDSSREIARRLRQARKEMACCKAYDYVIINNHLEKARAKLAAIIMAESCRINKD